MTKSKEYMSTQIDLIEEIAKHHHQHSRSSQWWQKNNDYFLSKVENLFEEDEICVTLGSAQNIKIEKISFGSITSAHLLGLDELILFAWYEVNRNRYSRVLDLGANIGVHSLVMSKLGFQVISYEPDPIHAKTFRKALKNNGASNVTLREKAVAEHSELVEFTRVLGNTTGSHITGMKRSPYGKTEKYLVQTDSMTDVILEGFEFIKMDVEGSEARILQSLSKEDFAGVDFMVEIGSLENAESVLNHIKRLKVNAFSQKNNWNEVRNLQDMPTSHREGSLFITTAHEMNWSSHDRKDSL